MPFGPLELGIILVIILLIFGPKRLPSLGRQLGGGMREFRDSITGRHKDDDDEDDPPQIAAAKVEAGDPSGHADAARAMGQTEDNPPSAPGA